MTTLEKFAHLANDSAIEAGQTTTPQQDLLRDLLIEIEPLSGSCEKTFDGPTENYPSLRAQDVSILQRLATVLPQIDNTKTNAVLINLQFNHSFNTIEGMQAMMKLINSLFPKHTYIGRHFRPTYGILIPEPDTIKWFENEWAKKFGNPPPIAAEEYLNSTQRVFQEPSAP